MGSSDLDRTTARQPVVVSRVVVMTLALMTSLVIYDGWHHLRFGDVAAVIIGPILAIFASHVFAGGLAASVELRRRLTGHERLALLAANQGSYSSRCRHWPYSPCYRPLAFRTTEPSK